MPVLNRGGTRQTEQRVAMCDASPSAAALAPFGMSADVDHLQDGCAARLSTLCLRVCTAPRTRLQSHPLPNPINCRAEKARQAQSEVR
eukprot:6178523-Pleurochrysis_carterae.AAC.2